jgi:hypothetical protein
MLWSLVGVFLIGLTTIAYKQPEVYRRITLGLIPIMLCLLFASVGWSVGQSSAYQSLAPHLSPDRVKVLMGSFLDAIDKKCLYDTAMLIVIAYLFFLGYLPRLRSRDAASADDNQDFSQSLSS